LDRLWNRILDVGNWFSVGKRSKCLLPNEIGGVRDINNHNVCVLSNRTFATKINVHIGYTEGQLIK